MAKADDVEKAVRARVARGRCLQGADGGVIAIEGDTVELSEAEFNRLVRSGHLIDPLAAEVARGEGPQFTTAAGPSVKAA